jgi:uncharacterized protein involved in response to NO
LTLSLVTLLIALIGGRVVPSFTTNWFARHALPRLAPSSPLLEKIVGWRTFKEPLLLVVHVGYAWVPIGLLILGGAIAVEPALITSGLHALTVGAIGTMTLAMMTRATLGHTGRQLSASKATSALYIAITISAICRVCAALYPDIYVELLIGAAAAWIVAFVLFVAVYGPMHLRQRLDAPAPSN